MVNYIGPINYVRFRNFSSSDRDLSHKASFNMYSAGGGIAAH